MSSTGLPAGAQERITQAVLQWDGVSAAPHRFGGTEYRLGTREIGHIHGDMVVDIPFPTKIRHELVNSGRARPHHFLPKSGWVCIYIERESDVIEAVALLRRSLELARSQRRRRQPST